MISWIVIILFLAAGFMLVILPYLKNKQADREWDRRERLQEKQEQLMGSLRARKEEEEKNTE
jgi:hypothetical protein